MKLYKISQEENQNYETYDSAIVAAENEEEARGIVPGDDDYKYIDGELATSDNSILTWSAWALYQKNVKVEYLGEAKEGTKKGEILGSFNAG